MAFETIKLPTASVGNQTHIHLHRFGPSGGKKVYIQAGLHADEYPGLLVAQHLLRHLNSLTSRVRSTQKSCWCPLLILWGYGSGLSVM